MVDWEAFYSSFREPDYVPGYEILERLGGGAFGEVYRARKRSIGKSYAIKFLKVGDDRSSEIIERELAHARLFAAIDHPNLVAIEDLGQVDGVPYVVMGYAGEDTLARCLKRDTLDATRAFELFVQVCRGVLALHERNLVHFDLKPSNVFIRGDVARVGDYGLAKLIADGRQTLSIGRGTPHYMAPEVLKGRADQRADIYSLGVILFETFAGRVPFDGDSALAALLRDEPRAIAFPDGFPARLRDVVERCLSADPDARPNSVAALLEELGQTGRAGEDVPLPFDPAFEIGRERDPEQTSTLSGGPPTPVDDVVEWETLGIDEDPSGAPAVDTDPGPVHRPGPAPAAGSAPVYRAGPAPAAAPAAGPFATGARFAGGVAAAPIPVPPRFEGALPARVVAVLAIGLEMFLALIHGPVRASLGAGSRGLGSVLRGTLGLARWVLVSFLLGAAAAALLLFVASV